MIKNNSQIWIFLSSIKTTLIMVLENIKIAIVALLWFEILHLVYDAEKISIFWKTAKLPYIEKIGDILVALKSNFLNSWFLILVSILILLYIAKKVLLLLKHLFINSFNSRRFDILFTVITVIFVIVWGYPQVEYFTYWIIFLILLSISVSICSLDTSWNHDWFLLSDNPYNWIDWDDILNYKLLAKQFAKNIFNNWSKDSLVFSVESDWWNWKTSFLNLVIDNDDIKNNCIVFNFEAWHFNWESDLLEKFLNELKNTLNKTYYLPNISSQFNDLISVLWEEWINKVFWIKAKLSSSKTLEDIKNSINESLKNIDKKLIIIIDDIDRMPINKAKILFRIIDLCRNFHNTSYILCYDNENFNSIDEVLKVSKGKFNFEASKWNIELEEEIDNKNVRSYLEKVVNVKYSLVPDINEIKKFFYKTFTDWSVEFSENSKAWIKDWIDNLFKLGNFEIFWKHLKNIRKIKRLYNFFLIRYYWNKNLILNIFDTKNNWLNFENFIKLSILNLFHDRLYCDIVNDIQLLWWEQTWYALNTEWISKYKLQYDYSSNRSTYKTPESFKKYIETLTLEQKNILISIFPIYDKYNPDNNLDLLWLWNRLLEHIKLIESVNSIDYNKDISDYFERIKNTNENLSSIFSDALSKHKARWVASILETFEKNVSEVSVGKTEEILNYIIDEFHQYSINSLASCWDNIARILDRLVSHENTKENCIAIIWKYIYSENDSIWMLDKFCDENWWIKWIYNMLGIRLLAERTSSLWNFQRWIVWERYELNLPKIVYYEKISRYIYWLFKSKYIDSNINIFKLIDELSEDDLLTDEWVNTFWVDTKNWIQSFIIYQLTNDSDWIWHFDITDDGDINNQGHWIKTELNDYYFNICFRWEKWIKYLIEYIFWFIFLPTFSDKSWIDSNHIKIRLLKTDSQDWNILNIFEEWKLKTFIDSNSDSISNFIEIHCDEIFEWFNWVKFSYWFWWELFKKRFNECNSGVLHEIIEPSSDMPEQE